jgi:hypothetical protein
MQHRLSNKERPMSPELSSAFPESVRAAEGDKEVVAYQQPQPLPYQRPVDGAGGGDGKKVMGMRKKWFLGLLVPLVLLVVLGVALGVGLGVGLNSKDRYVALIGEGARNCRMHMSRLGPDQTVTKVKQLSYPNESDHDFVSHALFAYCIRGPLRYRRRYQSRVLHNARCFQWIRDRSCFSVILIEPSRRAARITRDVLPTQLWPNSV